MSIDPAIFRALVAQGATPEMLLAVVEADAAVEEARRAKKRDGNAERQRRFKAGKRQSNADNALPSVTERYPDQLPPNDIYSNPPENPGGAKAPPSPIAEKLVSEWNAGPAANGARRSTKLDASRKALLKARLRDHTEAEILSAIGNLAASRFHCGENDRGWRADLGWFLKAENFLKALEMAETRTGPKAVPVTDQAAYLAKLEAQPWASATPRAEARPRVGNTGPPAAIGDLVQRLAERAA